MSHRVRSFAWALLGGVLCLVGPDLVWGALADADAYSQVASTSGAPLHGADVGGNRTDPAGQAAIPAADQGQEGRSVVETSPPSATGAIREQVKEPVPAAHRGEVSGEIVSGLRQAIHRVRPWLDRWGYGAVAFAVGIEGFGIPAPGQTLLIAAAVESAAHPKLRIGWVLVAAFAAAVFGNSVGYWIGRWGGRAWVHRFPGAAAHLHRVEAGFERWGPWLILFARFVEGARQLNGIAAGVLEMPWWRFTLLNCLGAALWVGAWGLGAYYLDAHRHGLLAFLHGLNPWTAVLAAVSAVAFLILYWRRSSSGR
jgi:membrane protein DedA with SNARE-associated domain